MKRLQAILCVVLVSSFGMGLSIPSLAFLNAPPHSDRGLFVAPLDVIPNDGVPRIFDVNARSRDAWVQHEYRGAGRCYLLRRGDKVQAFLPISSRGTAVCYNAQFGTFEDQCYGVQFDLNGNIRTEKDRGFLLPLQTVPVTIDKDGIWVRSRKFLQPTMHFGPPSP